MSNSATALVKALGVCAVLLAALPVGAAAAPGDFVGTWVRDQRERDDTARDETIVRATEPMSFAFRSFARGVMRKRMVPVEQYFVEMGAGTLQIRNDKGVVFPLDDQVRVTGENREVKSRLSERGEIEQEWKEGDSHGTTTWRLTGGDRLTVSQRVFDSHFEAPLEYSTTYRRAAP
jgi:hypothetical protein